MIDALKTLVIYKIQSHESTVLRFNRTGVHRINGTGTGNSNGKSVIMKCLYALCLGEDLDKTGRESLINWDSEFGIIVGESYNGVKLTLFMHLEASKCFYELEVDGQKVRKYLSDDYKTLLKVFNFHYMPDEKFSLNRYKTKTALPFTHFSGTLNYKILDSASEVPEVKQTLEVIDEKLMIIKGHREDVTRKVVSLSEQLKLMDDSGIDEIRKKLLYVETLNDSYKELKPISNKIKEIIHVKEEKQNLVKINPEHYVQFGKELKRLNKLSINLTAVIDKTNEIEELRSKQVAPPKNLNQTINQVKLLESLGNLTKAITDTNKKMNEVSNVEKPIDLRELISIARNLGDLKYTVATNVVTQEKLAELVDIPIERITEMRNVARQLYQLQDLSVSLIKTTKQLNNSKEQQDILPINGIIEGLRSLGNMKRLTDYLSESYVKRLQLQETISNINSDIERLVEEVGLCEYCGNLLTNKHVHN